jgi:hypothetical protein
MSNKEQTAVEWLYKELALNNNSIDSIKERIYKESEIWKQAKAMHKEEIIDSFGVGCQVEASRLIGYHKMAEQYYNEIYGKDE